MLLAILVLVFGSNALRALERLALWFRRMVVSVAVFGLAAWTLYRAGTEIHERRFFVAGAIALLVVGEMAVAFWLAQDFAKAEGNGRYAQADVVAGFLAIALFMLILDPFRWYLVGRRRAERQAEHSPSQRVPTRVTRSGAGFAGQAPPPGWYGDPGGTGARRWWTGAVWSEHLRDEPPLKAK